MNSALLYILSPLLLLLVGFGSSFLSSAGNNQWYQNLTKAPWTPPSYLFGLVWAILYILLGVLLANTLLQRDTKAQLILLVSIILVVVIWPFLYFLGQLQLLSICLLLILICLSLVYCGLSIQAKSVLRCVLILPLIIWGCYATSLAAYAYLNTNPTTKT